MKFVHRPGRQSGNTQLAPHFVHSAGGRIDSGIGELVLRMAEGIPEFWLNCECRFGITGFGGPTAHTGMKSIKIQGIAGS